MGRLKSLSDLLLIAGFAIIIVLWGYCAAVVFNLRDNAWSEAMNRSDALLHSVERTIDRDFELYSLSLSAVVEGLNNSTLDDVSPEVRRLALFDRAAQAPGFGSIFVMDQHGTAFIDSGSAIPRTLNGSDRKYFQIHRDHDMGLFIGTPWKTRMSGRFMIPLSRRLSYADGSFAGVVVGAIELTYFETVFKRLNPDGESRIDVIFDDGEYLSPETDLSQRSALDALSDDEILKLRGRYSGRLISAGQPERRPRMNTFSSVGKLPIHVNVSSPVDVIDAKWRKDAIPFVVIVTILSLTVAPLLILLRRELRRRAQAEADLNFMIMTDPLTGIPNRRNFDKVLKELHRGSISQNVTIVLLDVDFFKAYNDSYGHPAGDVALREIGNVISKLAQQYGGIGFRIGGEEFAIIVASITEAQALLLSDETRRLVERRGILHEQGFNKVVTVSVGVMHNSRYRMATADQWLQFADEALYKAKKAGRNRIFAAGLYGSSINYVPPNVNHGRTNQSDAA